MALQLNDADEEVILLQRFKSKLAKWVVSEIDCAVFDAEELEEDKMEWKMEMLKNVLEEIAQIPSHQVDNCDDENEEDDNEMEDNEVKDNVVEDEEDEIVQIDSLQVDNIGDENDEDDNETEDNEVKDNEVEDHEVEAEFYAEEIRKDRHLFKSTLVRSVLNEIAQNDSTQTNNREDILDIVKKHLLDRKIVKEVIIGDNDETHQVHLINMMSMFSQEHVGVYVLDDNFFEEFDKKTSTNDLDEWKFLLSREIAKIPSHLPKNKVNCDKMIHIKNDHEETVDIDNNEDIMFLYQDLSLRQKCPTLSSSKTNPHLHFKFTKPNSYSPKVYRRIVKKYFIKKFNKYYPSEKSTQKEMFHFVQCFVFDIRLAMHCIFTQKEELFIQSLDLLSGLDKISKLFILGNKSNWKKWKIENEFYNFYNFSIFKNELFMTIHSL